MPNFKRQMSGGASVAAGPLRPHNNRLGTFQAASYWKGGGLSPIPNLQFVVVGGGEATGGHGGGGGGSYRSSVTGETTARGAAVESMLEIPRGDALVVTVGGSSSNSVFHTITSLAGFGADFYTGGGGGTHAGAAYAGGAGASGGYFRGGGGGGAGGGGRNANTCGSNCSGGAGSGGEGISTNITGTSYYIAGGGGGGARGFNDGNNVCSFGAGGQGGGGSGAYAQDNTGNCVYGCTAGSNGATNTGGGGGGYAYGCFGGAGYSGGSGVVMIRYLASEGVASSISAGLTYSTGTTGAYRFYRFTAGTGTITF